MSIEQTRNLRRLFDTERNLTGSEFLVLTYMSLVCRDGEDTLKMSQEQIARRCRMSRATAHKAITGLMEKGYISREVGTRDNGARGIDTFTVTTGSVVCKGSGLS